MKKSTKKIFNIIFCLCIMLIFIQTTYAKDIKNVNNEIISLREEYVKHFQNEDGSITAVSYPQPIHYKDSSGNWKDINNSLVDKISYKTSSLNSSNNENNYFTLQDNPLINVSFNKKTNGKQIIKFKVDDYEISWGLDNLNDSQATILSNDSKDKYNLTNIVSGVKYENAFENSDLYYYASSTNLKEEIHINEKNNLNKLTYNITTNLSAVKTEHNLIMFQTAKNETIFIFQNPYMYDSAEKSAINYNTKVDLIKIKEGYQIIYSLDEDWLNDINRVYPIIIDPVVTNGRSQTSVLDTYVHPGDSPSHNHVNEDRLWVGKVNGTSRAFFNWSALPSINGIINSAHVSFNYFYGTSSWGALELWQVNDSWNSENLTWDIHNNLSKTRLYTNLSPTNSNGYKNFSLDVTNTIYNWYKGNLGKNGFMVKYADESYYDYNTIISSDGGLNSDYWPCLYIDYENKGTPEAYVASFPSQGISEASVSATNILRNNHYVTTYANNPTANSIIQNWYKNVVVYSGHGNYEMQVFGDNGISSHTNNETASLYTPEDGTKSRFLVGLGQFNLSPNDLIIFAGCETSNSEHGVTSSLARKAVDYGVKASIGWEKSIGISAVRPYLDNLLNGLMQGKTIQQSIDYANSFSTVDSRIRTSHAWGNTSSKINVVVANNLNRLSTTNVENSNKLKEHIIYQNFSLKNSFNNLENEAINYIKKNLDSTFNLSDYNISYSDNGRYITFTYAPFGIKTDNVYTAIIESNHLFQINEYKTDDLNQLKNLLKNISLLSTQDKEELKNKLLLEKNNDFTTTTIYEDGYVYKENKTFYYLTYNQSSKDGLLNSDTILYEI